MTPIEMILIVAACFVAAVLNLAIDSRFRRRLTRFALVTAGIIGSVFYGYGYGWTLGLSIPSVIRALMALSLERSPEEVPAPADYFTDLGGSSLDYYAFGAALEEETGVSLPREGAPLRTAEAVAGFVREASGHVDQAR